MLRASAGRKYLVPVGNRRTHVFQLLVNCANRGPGKPRQNLCIEDLVVDFVGDFLDHLENERGDNVRICDARLAAMRSPLSCVAEREPHHAALADWILAIGRKRCSRRDVEFLDGEEREAPLRAPDRPAGSDDVNTACYW